MATDTLLDAGTPVQARKTAGIVGRFLHFGDGDPEGVEYARQGAIYFREDGDATTTWYGKITGGVDEANLTNTGWQAFASLAATILAIPDDDAFILSAVGRIRSVDSVAPTADHGRAMGRDSVVSAEDGWAEGTSCEASGLAAHAEGDSTAASGSTAHAEGQNATASGASAHAEGLSTNAVGDYSHAEGESTFATGDGSHAEGVSGHAEGVGSHVEGESSFATGNYSHAEGISNTAAGEGSHAEGQSNNANGDFSHVEGYSNTAESESDHAEGENCTASGAPSHAEGYFSTAAGFGSHAEGNGTTANGTGSHAEGGATASSDFSHAEGSDGVADHFAEHAASGFTEGQYSRLYVKGQTTDDTITELLLGDGGHIAVPAGEVWMVTCEVAAKATAGGTAIAGFFIRAFLGDVSGTLTLVDIPTVARWDTSGASTWESSIDVSGSNMRVLVQGEVAKTIRWVGTVHATRIH